MIDFHTQALDERLRLVDFDKTDASTLKALVEQDLKIADEFLDNLPAPMSQRQLLTSSVGLTA